MSYVIITHLPEGDYQRQCVCLPPDYGSIAYERQPEVQAIRRAVEETLAVLDEKCGFTRQLAGRTVLLKPNLVTVFSRLGLRLPEYPETTDPRVIEALVIFLKRYTSRIIIAESSGRGFPTRGAFRLTGLYRLAKRHGVELAALEEQPYDRYYLPKARVDQEMLIPRLFSPVVRGEAFYISVPKLKTNLYTGVTLSFKNGMGLLPYNLRQRSHHYALVHKLVDILSLVRPNLVLIDGVVGGEGNCPAPVLPVDSRVILSGTNSVETDRVAAGIMGFDPDSIDLIRAADERGFGDPQVEVIGERRVIPFRQADPSLLSDYFCTRFPNVRVLVGQEHPGGGVVGAGARPAPTVEELRRMELRCRGGCLAVTRFAFDMLEHEGQRTDFALTVIIGEGVQVGGERVYFGLPAPGVGAGLAPAPWAAARAAPTAYTVAEIAALPGKKLAVGDCSGVLAGVVDRFIPGCMPLPNSVHNTVHSLSGTLCRALTPANRHLLPLLWDTLQAVRARQRLLRSGERIDVELGGQGVGSTLAVDQGREFVAWPMPPLSQAEIRRLVKAETRSLLGVFSAR